MRKCIRKERDRLKIDMQFQVHTAEDDKMLRSGKRYAEKAAPGNTPPANRKLTFKDHKVKETLSLPSSPVEMSTEGMDSEEGQKVSKDLYYRLDKLGVTKGKSSLDPYERARRGLEVLADKQNLARPLRVSGRGRQRVEVSEGGTTVSSQIGKVPEYQEEVEIGEKGTSIHPPRLVEGPSDKGLRERIGDLKYPIPQYSVWTLADQVRKGIQPTIGDKPIGFVPYKGPTTVTRGSPRNPGYDLYLPIGGGLAITQMSAWHIKELSPEGNPMVQVMLDLWREKHGVSFYDIDTVMGQVYITKDGNKIAINEKCSHRPIVGTEVMSTTPIGGLGMGKLVVETPQASIVPQVTPPVAESTRKQGGKPLPPDLGESFLEKETRGDNSNKTLGRAYSEPEEQPSRIQLKPVEGTLGGGPEPEISSPEDEHIILQREEQERRRIAKLLAEEAQRSALAEEAQRMAKIEEAQRLAMADEAERVAEIEEAQQIVKVKEAQRLAREAEKRRLLAEQKKQIEAREKAEREAKVRQEKEEEERRKLEEEHRNREQKRQELLHEKERIRQERKAVLITHINLLAQGKKDLRMNLLNLRDEQLSSGLETEKVRESRREELQTIYKEYAQRVVGPILEYWDLDDHTPEKACTIPINALEDYEIAYKSNHKWTEKELMKLLFNLEEIKLEPQYWQMARSIRDAMYPGETEWTNEMYSRIKKEWEYKYSTGVQWQIIAETAIKQLMEIKQLSAETQKKKNGDNIKRPTLVAPQDLGDVNQKHKETRARNSSEGETGKTRKVGQSGRQGPPTPKEMTRAREDAVKAAADITGGTNDSKSVRANGGKGTPRSSPRQNNNGQMGSVYTPPFVPRDARRRVGPVDGSGKIISPPYPPKREWYCDNCQSSHGGPICPCPICKRVGHIYYLCPHRDEKESNGVAPDKNWTPTPALCHICGTKHEGPCTLGYKQNLKVQEMLSQRQKEFPKEKETSDNTDVKRKGNTPFCMHCGLEDN